MARVLMVLSLILGCTEAKDFGVQGTTYRIEETSMLEYIRSQLSGLSESVIQQKQLEVQSRARQSVQRLKPVEGLRRATERRSYTYDPSITLDRDILDSDGNVIARKGQDYNPMQSLKLKDALLVFDGEDETQLQWAINQGASTKWILVNGRPLELSEQYQRPVYFDQGGAICRKFKLQAVPARIQQEGDHLRIHEGFGGECNE